MTSYFDNLALRLNDFAIERDWKRYHSPKNLAMALSVECAELVEHFQWLTERESEAHSEDKLESIANEAADVLIYLVQLTDKLGIDLAVATERKIEINRQKYPGFKTGK